MRITDRVRFKVLPAREVDASLREHNEEYDWACWVLVEFDAEGNQVRVVGEDGGEPEDQMLIRDWAWVEVEMNKLADEAEHLRRALAEANLQASERR